MKKLLLFLCALLILPGLALAAEPAPIDSAGLNALMAKNRGKVVMLNFFATWCPPCRAEIPEIVKMRKKFPEDKVAVIGLSVDETANVVEPFMAKTGINYPVYMATKEITDAFRVSQVPHNAFFDPAGKLVISEPGMADANVLDQVVQDLMK